MNLANGQEEARQFHNRFMNSMYCVFGIAQCPNDYPIDFEPMFSMGGLKPDSRRGLRIALNDALIIEPIDKLQFEQTIYHETGHILHLIGNGWKMCGRVDNAACNEPVGSIIADLGVLVFSELIGKRAEDFFQKLNDYAGPARELFEKAKFKGANNPERLLRELTKQTVRELYLTVESYLGKNYLYDDKQIENAARKLATR